MDGAIDLVELRAQTSAIWTSLVRPCVFASFAADISAGHYLNGDRQRAQIGARVAIGEAAAAWAAALDTRDAYVSWEPIAGPMATAAKIYVAHLEAQLAVFQRRPRFQGQPLQHDHKAQQQLEIHWSAADKAMRQLYASLDGNPNDPVTFADLHEQMKAGLIASVAPKPERMPWPEMEN